MSETFVPEWEAARETIGDFLHELLPHQALDLCQSHAATLLARLSGHRPPIVLSFYKEQPEPGG